MLSPILVLDNYAKRMPNTPEIPALRSVYISGII